MVVKELGNFEYPGHGIGTIETWNLNIHAGWSLPQRMVGGTSLEGVKVRNKFVEFGVEGALCRREGALILSQNGNGLFKLRESGNECCWPWGGVNGSTS